MPPIKGKKKIMPAVNMGIIHSWSSFIPESLQRLTPIITPAQKIKIIPLKLLEIKATLEYFGITDLSKLGKLTISGNVIPQPGMTKPSAEIYGPVVTFHSAHLPLRQITPNTIAEPIQRAGGVARHLKAEYPKIRKVVKGDPPIISLNTCYWAATWIDLPDDTRVILQTPNQYLTIITQKLTVGKNVSFTWQMPPCSSQPPLPKQAKLAAQPVSNDLSGIDGQDGVSGVSGNKGQNDGADAPQIELWLVDLQGDPSFILAGQDGCQGQQGQDGQDGQDGGAGRPSLKDNWGFCKSGPGSGGNGGNGGAAGNGGPGSNGGHGGKLSIYAPQSVLDQYVSGFLVTINGGSGGQGGMPGIPGSGGKGGPVGAPASDIFGVCKPGKGRIVSAGSDGSMGTSGNQGQGGVNGDMYNPAIVMTPITKDEFLAELTVPAIMSINPGQAKQGDTVEIMGARFAVSDTVLIDGASYVATVLSDTMIQFVVPAVQGGNKTIQIKRMDGTMSNRATLQVIPTISLAQQNGKNSTDPAVRFEPNSTVTLIGTGFSPNAMVRVNNQDAQNINYINPNSMTFTIMRPVGATPHVSGTAPDGNPIVTGEDVSIEVIVDGLTSNFITSTIRTFNILVLGDSIQWGQGLLTNQKFSSLVAQAVQAKKTDRGVFTTVLAHSGAIIGNGVTATSPTTPGEVPNPFPTIFQQCDGFATMGGMNDMIDLILMDGGINDVGVPTIINPFGPDLSSLIEQNCHQDMSKLLQHIQLTFTNAEKIIVTGYYQILSNQSNIPDISTLQIILGLLGLPGLVLNIAIDVALIEIVSRCSTFSTKSAQKLQQAVDEANATPGPKVFLAIPSFGPANSIFAPNSFLFGFNPDLSPQDPVSGSRAVSCIATGATGVSLQFCEMASTGHPNPAGAVQYFNTINPLL